MGLLRFVIIRLSVFLVAGIVTAHYFDFPIQWLHIALTAALAVFLFCWNRSKRQLIQDFWFGLATAVLFFVLGAWNYQIHQEFNHKNHFLNHSSFTESHLLEIKVRDILKSSRYEEKYVAEIITIDQQPVSGKVLLNVRKDSLSIAIDVDEVLVFYAPLQQLPKSRNPHQFDYASYLNKQGIYRQLSVTHGSVLHKYNGTPTWKGKTFQFRKKLRTALENSAFQKEEIAIINAILMGQRHDITSEMYDDYAAAGAIHILAISGLHVGIVMLLLQFFFRPLERLPKGKLWSVLAVVLCLWAFAFFTGLSPSVLRTTTMFTFVTVGMQLKRHTNPFNTLISSAFLLLLIDPNLLFQVGFQLSYMAVFGILLIFPLLQSLYQFKWKISQKIWEVVSVSVAAQAGVLPLSLFYFHQFPGLFLLTNVVIIPFLGIILGAGIIILIFAAFNFLPQWLVLPYAEIISGLNAYIKWVATQEQFVFSDIPFSALQSILFYLLLLALVLLWKQLSFRNLAFVLISVLCFQLSFSYHKFENTTTELVFFHSGRNTTIGVKTGQHLQLFSTLDSGAFTEYNFVKDYVIGNRIEQKQLQHIPTIFKFRKENILIIDSLSVYASKNTSTEIVLLTQSPKLNLERLLDSLKPKMIIADGSNYPSYVNRWRVTCEKRKLPFHHTTTEGALVIN
jgi:competence protein ComEC